MTGSRGHDWLKIGLLGAAAALALPAGCGARTGLDPGRLRDAAAEPDAEVDLPPECPDRAVSKLRLGAVRQMDLLFVVDSSASMADKQALLIDAVPPLVSRLVNPWCLDPVTGSSVSVASPDEECPQGYSREFAPLEDLHIGVITTSLGGHGGQVCRFETSGRISDDHARLLPSVRGGLPSYQGLGFLAWDPEGDLEPPGEADAQRLEADFLSHVSAVGENGCGYEAPLEAFYRFLVDPAPPADVIVGDCPGGGTGCTEKIGVDQLVLQQRSAFLRPDSVVAILILSDENDCSIVDEGQGWLVGQVETNGAKLNLPRATSTCATDPNDPCCQSCAVSASIRPAGCPAIADDPECQKGAWTDDEDSLNLRCFDQKRRFGFDLLYPVERYVNALREPTICPDSKYRDLDCNCLAAREQALQQGLPEPPCTSAETGAPITNPLYSNLSGEAAFARDPSQVFLAGIVGIPWQDLATPETLSDPTRLEYLTAEELHEVDPASGASRWDVILGNRFLGLSGDPFLVESVGPRSGVNPITGAPIVAPQTTDPLATINGHEFQNPTGSTLQHACIFPLETPRVCGDGGLSCDCDDDEDFDPTNALCQEPNGLTAPFTQYFAKAYPSRRLLEVLRNYGENAITSSICPKLAGGDSADLGVGYRPAVASLVQRFRCASLDAHFESDPTSQAFGQVPCTVLAVSEDGSCNCEAPGRRPAAGEARDEVLRLLEQQGSCGGATGVPCETYCMCELQQLTQEALQRCQTETAPPPGGPPLSGWCYVDPAEGFGSTDVVASCPVGHERNVRALGSAAPLETETLYSVCVPKCADD